MSAAAAAPPAPAKRAYDASSLGVLEGISAIRKRPGMYIGSADDDGVLKIISEIVDNSVDEAMNGYGSHVYVTINSETGSVRVRDEARGIPVDEHPKYPGVSGLEIILSRMHSGGKFETGELSYGTSGGLHGIGLKCVTALSRIMRATVWRDGYEHWLDFKDSMLQGPLARKRSKVGVTGTQIEYTLDLSLLADATSAVPNKEVLKRGLHERAYLNPELHLHLDYDGETTEFHEPLGLASMVQKRVGSDALTDKVISIQVKGEIPVFLAVAWTRNGRADALGFCNSIRQPDGGKHVTGYRMALPPILREYILAAGLIPAKDKNLTIDPADCLDGSFAVVSIRHANPVYSGQAKTSLSNNDAQGAVQRAINVGLKAWLEENPKEARLIAARTVAAARAREAAQRAKDKSKKEDEGVFGMRSFGKLADCSERNNARTELMLVEGDSAAGPAKMARDKAYQAVYPLRGKPLNTWEVDAARALLNAEMSDLTAAIGCGLFDPDMTSEMVLAAMEKRRYDKIIIMCDADIDGAHIQCLLLGHLFKWQRPLVEAGHVYLAQPPLYRVTERGKHKYIQDLPKLERFFADRIRAADLGLVSAAGEDKAATRALAGRARSVREATEEAAGRVGTHPSDLAVTLVSMLGNDVADVPALAQAVAATHRSLGAEAVVVEPAGEGVVLVRGLGGGGRYFTTVVNAALWGATEALWGSLEAILKDQAGPVALSPRLRHGQGEAVGTFYEFAARLEAEAERGLKLQRIKGLGEMNPEELGATTIDPTKRRLTRILSANFSEAGEFIHSMLSNGQADARKDVVRAAELSREEIDA